MSHAASLDSGLASVCNSHEKVPWAKSKALLGSLTGLQRSRVSELINPEPDRPLAPHWRASRLLRYRLQCLESKVQQRGLDATGGIITRLLEGLDCPPGQKLLLVDVLPSRWGSIDCHI